MRIPHVTRELVRADQREVFDEVAPLPNGPGTGPMSVLKNSPELARRALPLFGYVRNESTVPQKLRELAMITTARAMDCPYIWNAHAKLGRESGLSDALVDALRDNKALPEMPPDESAVYNFCTEMFASKRVSEATFHAVHTLLGTQGLVELTSLVGFYTMLAFNANAVELDLPKNLSEIPLPV